MVHFYTLAFKGYLNVFQAYTSQFISLVLFGLMMCEDRISMQERRRQIIQGLKELPGKKHKMRRLHLLTFRRSQDLRSCQTFVAVKPHSGRAKMQVNAKKPRNKREKKD